MRMVGTKHQKTHNSLSTIRLRQNEDKNQHYLWSLIIIINLNAFLLLYTYIFYN